MTEEMTNQEQGLEQDYLAQIQEMKKNSVSREAYDKQLEENRKLLNAIVKGEQLDKEETKEEKKTISELREAFVNTRYPSDMEWLMSAVNLRDALIDKGDEDPAVPQGHKISATREDYESASRVAEGFKYCYEYANGDPEVFINELQRITKDVVIPGVRRR